ncbi:MAG: SDR family NAD(P)-dependent oxidoreductase [Clostridia bacterium]|nr:SDR family NAD(P)-dependent oxidoreductase [Clostridia bacterium]
MKNWLKNNRIVITGASSGIGKELTKIFITKYNCFVLGVARDPSKLEDLKKQLQSIKIRSNKKDVEIKDYSVNFDYISADVSKEKDWENIFNKAQQLDCNILINNAGTMLPFLKAENILEEDIKRIFDTNFYSVVRGCKTFCDYFKNKNQSCGIINITSVAAVCSMPGQSAYSASKSAATSYSKIMASELNNKVFVATYLPGFTKTNLFYNKDNKTPIFEEKLLKILNIISMPADKLAKKIVKKIAQKKRYKVFGFDSKIYRFLNFIAPSKSTDLYLKIFKKTKSKSFEDLF